ncbi:MAG: GNAT family N-acetyltransferase [Gammaproteobacteria bacterium]
MLPGSGTLGHGLQLRPSRPSDQPFLETLYRASREDLQLIDAEDEFIDALIEMQFEAQTKGYGDMFPNAMYFIVEYHGERIGRVTLDFGSTEIRVVDLSLIPQARGKGLGSTVLRHVQMTAQKIMVPVSLSVAAGNVVAAQLYQKLGFQVAETSPMYAQMVWYPRAAAVN